MSQEQSRSRAPLYSQIDVSQGPGYVGVPHGARGPDTEQTHLLRQLLAGQDRQNELLEELVSQLGAAQKQRAVELGQWKQANPHSGPELPGGGRGPEQDPDRVPGQPDPGGPRQLRRLARRGVHAQRVRGSFWPAAGPSERAVASAFAVERDSGAGQRAEFAVSGRAHAVRLVDILLCPVAAARVYCASLFCPRAHPSGTRRPS